VYWYLTHLFFKVIMKNFQIIKSALATATQLQTYQETKNTLTKYLDGFVPNRIGSISNMKWQDVVLPIVAHRLICTLLPLPLVPSASLLLLSMTYCIGIGDTQEKLKGVVETARKNTSDVRATFDSLFEDAGTNSAEERTARLGALAFSFLSSSLSVTSIIPSIIVTATTVIAAGWAAGDFELEISNLIQKDIEMLNKPGLSFPKTCDNVHTR
jgi:hypothetical protein